MTPERQQQIASPTVEVFLSIEEQLLMNIAKRLAKHRTLLEELEDGEQYLSWQTKQLSMLEDLTQQNIITIAKWSGLAIDEVSRALEMAGFQAVGEYEGELEEAVREGKAVKAPSIEESTSLQNVLVAYQAQAVDKFNMVNSTLLEQSQQVYLDIINQTVGKVLAGVQTPHVALRETARKWANHGIPAFIDKAGRRWSTEATVNMIMRSTVNNVANDMQFARMDDYGVDLVEVSSHSGARPRCAPFQGKIFSRSGNHKRFPPLSSTSYGEPAGLKGVNCHHVFYPYIEGLSRKRHEPFNQKENREVYELTQKQRYLEREIRKAKKELKMMEVMGDEEGVKKAKEKVRNKQANMREFINQTGLTRYREREQIV